VVYWVVLPYLTPHQVTYVDSVPRHRQLVPPPLPYPDNASQTLPLSSILSPALSRRHGRRRRVGRHSFLPPLDDDEWDRFLPTSPTADNVLKPRQLEQISEPDLQGGE
jgi:hypothetical protein